jgi:hypothetical protein
MKYIRDIFIDIARKSILNIFLLQVVGNIVLISNANVSGKIG